VVLNLSQQKLYLASQLALMQFADNGGNNEVREIHTLVVEESPSGKLESEMAASTVTSRYATFTIIIVISSD
jgi:hypothetical protein